MDKDFGEQLGKLLGNAREMQEKMETAQKELANVTATGAAGGDMVQVTINGARKVVRVQISDEAMDDRDMLQDLIAAATTDAMRKIEQTINAKMQASFAGNLGGLF